ncbi:MAG: VWA domain-containing protein [Mariprofundaceae bacterium]|nr:VWA domain-containing protein [Mariprofundaceae bacterium]
MLEFIWLWVFALIPLPLLIYFLPPIQKQRALLYIPFAQEFSDTVVPSMGKKHSPLLWLAMLVWLLLLVAAARPQWVGEAVDIPRSGRDLMLAVDLSGSMQVKDFELGGQMVDRLEAIKAVAGQFIQQREGDRLALILFGEQAYIQTPLTFDRQTIHILLNEAVIGMAGQKTAIGDAIGLSLKHLDEKQREQRVLILLTDGANTAGEVSPKKAASLAAEAGLTIYTIGVGADKMMVQTLFGRQQVNPSADLDEKTLREVAESTGGRYFRAKDTAGLAAIYALLDELEPVAHEQETFRPHMALHVWPLTAALLFFVLMLSLRVRHA